MDYLRRSAGISRLDNIKSNIIRQKQDTTKYNPGKIETHLGWFGYIMKRKDKVKKKEVKKKLWKKEARNSKTDMKEEIMEIMEETGMAVKERWVIDNVRKNVSLG